MKAFVYQVGSPIVDWVGTMGRPSTEMETRVYPPIGHGMDKCAKVGGAASNSEVVKDILSRRVKSDVELFRDMLTRARIHYTREDRQPTEISRGKYEHTPGDTFVVPGGFPGFYTNFEFGADGRLVSISAWK